MSDAKIMYVCGVCEDGNPEGCGHFDRNDLAVMPDGTWLCEFCADEADILDGCGVKPTPVQDDDFEWPRFSSFPKPPEYVPAT